MDKRFFCISDKFLFDNRVRALNRRLNKAKNTIIGGNVSLLPLITDDNGKLSEEKIGKLTEELFEALEEYENPEISDGKGGIVTDPREPVDCEPYLSPETAELYKCFLYCTLCILANGNITPMKLFPTFGELLNISGNSNAEVTRFLHNYILKTGDSLDILGNYVSIALGEDVLAQYYDKDYMCLSKVIGDSELAEIKKNWENALPDPQKFIEIFDKYVGMRYRKADCSLFKQDMEHMISVFLYNRGLSAFALGDDYDRIDHIVDMFCRSVEKECRKGVGKPDHE